MDGKIVNVEEEVKQSRIRSRSKYPKKSVVLKCRHCSQGTNVISSRQRVGMPRMYEYGLVPKDSASNDECHLMDDFVVHFAIGS